MILLFEKQGSYRLRIFLLVVIFLGMLYAGLRPKEYNFKNYIEWLEDKPGIRFRRYGLVFTKLIAPEGAKIKSDDARFSMEMAFKTDDYEEKGFRFILSMHNGNDQDQILVGQWGATIIVMKGDDFDYTRREPRISIKLGSQHDEPTFLTLATGKEVTRIYVNGRHVKTNPELNLQMPPGPSVWLTLGDSVYSKHSWSGDMLGLAIFNKTISAQDAETHFQRWKTDGNFLSAKVENPLHLYLFDEERGQIVYDHGHGNQDLEIPIRMRVLKKQILSRPWNHFKPNRFFISDIFINLLGFVPLGFVLSIVLRGSGRLSSTDVLMATVAMCFVFSLSIEIAQAWLPSRISSLLDWVLNTLGAWFGSFIASKGPKRRKLQ